MPTIQRSDDFNHGDFTVPGGGFYGDVDGPPVKDTTIVRPGDPCSCLFTPAGVAEWLGSGFASNPSIAWRGFAFRINTGEEPAANAVIAQFWNAAFSVGSRFWWIPATNSVRHQVNSGASQDLATTLDAWHWVEQIFDVSGTTHTIYTRVDGVDMTPATDAGTAITMAWDYLGPAGDTFSIRFSHHLWGSAANSTDWLGEPEVAGATYRRIYGPGQLAAAAATLYTAPAGARVQIRSLDLNNPSGSLRKVTFSIGSDAAGTRVEELFDVPAGESFNKRRGFNHTLEAGEFLQGYADSAGVVVAMVNAWVEQN